MPPAIFAAAKPFYQHVGDAMTQPPVQFEQTAEALKLALNPFVQTIAGSLKRVQPMLLEMNAKRTMLSSAIAISGVVKDSTDTVDGKPLDYTATARGFMLTSRAMHKGQPVRSCVGGK